MTRNHIPVSNGTLVLSKGESVYQQVLNEFANAEQITVVTYSITPANSPLLKSISSSGGNVTLICNIPKRFEKYRGKNKDAVLARKDEARKQIAEYLTAMDPTSFNTIVESYFCFRNHAKIVMTERIAFVGSANFTEASRESWECGFVTNDTKAIAQLACAVQQIKTDSVRYLGKPVDKLIAPHLQLCSCLSIVAEKLTEYCLDDLSCTLEDLKHAISAVDMPWAFAFESGGPITSLIDMDLIEQIEQLISDSDTLREFAKFDPDNISNDEFILNASEEQLIDRIEIATSDALCRLEEIRERAKSDLTLLNEGLITICGQIESTLKRINKAHDKIDNTLK